MKRIRCMMIIKPLVISLTCLAATSSYAEEFIKAALDPNVFDFTDRQSEILERLKASNLYESVQPVEVNEAALLDTHITFNASKIFGNAVGFSDLDIKVMQTFSDTNASAIPPTTFDIISAAEDPTSVVLSVHDGMITGAVTTSEFVYSVRPLGGGIHVVMRRELNNLPSDHIESEPTGARESEDLEEDALRREQYDEIRNSQDLQVEPEIGILVGFTKEAADSIFDTQAFAEAVVDTLNNALRTSRISAKFSISGVSHSSQPGVQGVVALERALLARNDGYYDEIGTEAQNARADITVVIFSRFPTDPCGKAAQILSNAENALAVVAEDCAIDKLTFAHEIGHLFGARHDIDTKETPYKFGHGYSPSGATWQSIMAQSCKNCGRTRKPVFSNPHIVFEGISAGDKEWSNEAEVFKLTAPVIAGFR